ncbi:hypothetical protein ASO20_00065 [Mycoplasma sp. (ex Biomphalaria glabrata)]|uniref:hypothetical protein n=1 Tax=Mycoplasma sp. (ex Biomphalaria glabrata) TaxID=1749074 RepID=UPI00073AB3C6|nr:hypothetical protein [Mycoplasma sp. (ex Biomphalaria glabrata)]ALV23075.1 hypothetical protein ASO20_00065 [Mycoplasma sp. (ex Biomphalaria glabrata)]
MKTKKLNLNKKSKIIVSLGAVVVLLAGLGVTLGETLTHKNTGITYTSLEGNITPSKYNLPTDQETVDWYNHLSSSTNPNLKDFQGLQTTEVVNIPGVNGWTKISSLTDPNLVNAFNNKNCNYPVGFKAVYTIAISVPNQDHGVWSHFLVMDDKNNILDCVQDFRYNPGVLAVRAGYSDWTTNAIQFDGTTK